MLRLSPTLRSYLHVPASHSYPNSLATNRKLRRVIRKAEQEAKDRNLDPYLWLALFTAATMTMCSSEAMIDLFQHVTASKKPSELIAIAEFMREVGLRCLGINGVGTKWTLPPVVVLIDKINSFHEQSTCSLHSVHRFRPTCRPY
jgi:ribosomal 50S subunit-associated protein YjgA (DUF615 family)